MQKLGSYLTFTCGVVGSEEGSQKNHSDSNHDFSYKQNGQSFSTSPATVMEKFSPEQIWQDLAWNRILGSGPSQSAQQQQNIASGIFLKSDQLGSRLQNTAWFLPRG